MAVTTKSYVPDGGQVEIEVTTADAAAMATFTVAQQIIIDGAVRMLENTTPKTRQHDETYVTGGNTPILTESDKETATVWSLTLVDEFTADFDGGEWGTDLTSAYEVLQAFFNAKRNINTIKVAPAGDVVGAVETTLSNVIVKTLPHPSINADATKPNEVVFTLVAESYTKAAIT